MEMFFCPLYSGSSGNALFVQAGQTRVLIDAGKPGRTLTEALNLIGVEPESLDAILITHEHSDHIAGAGVMARKYHVPVYATEDTWAAMDKKVGAVAPDLRRTFDKSRISTWVNWGWRPLPSPMMRPIPWATGCGAAA